MNDSHLPNKFTERAELVIPEFGTSLPSLSLEMSNIKEGERRLIEARAVNGATYADLEYSFNEGYREAKKNLSLIGYELNKARKIQRRIKSEYLLDQYPEFIKEKKISDNTANREAFLEKKEDYVAIQDRIDMLTAVESLLDGKVKVFENVCRYMRKEMDILLRSGFTGNKFIGNK